MSKVVLDPKDLSVWEANMKELRALQPVLAQRLEEWTEKHGHGFEHDETVTPKGTWISGLTEVPFFQPSELSGQPWRGREKEHVSVLFAYGVGVAPWLFRMVRAMPRTVMALVVLEPNLVLLARLLHTTNIYTALPEGCRLSFVTAPDDAEVEEALAVNVAPMGTYAAALAYAWSHPGEAECFREEIEALHKTLRDKILVRLQGLGNSAEDTLLGLRQIALNAPWIVFGPSLNSIIDDFRGRPFIWVASGPSLDKNVHLLKENRDRAVVICADTAAKKLLGLGIVPHIVVSLERVLEVYDYLEKIWAEYPDEAKDILLVSQAVCVPELAKWPGPHVVVGKREIPIDQWLIGGMLQGDVLFSGLSVAHMGIWLAAVLGASSLALTGQDLAFGEGQKTHADSTVSAEHAPAAPATGRELEVPAALGGTVQTDEIWFLFLKIMEQYIERLPVPVFDCSEGGALIKGTDVRPLDDWMREHLEGVDAFSQTPSERIRAAVLSPDEREAAARRVSEQAAGVQRFIEDSRENLKALQRGVERVVAPALTAAQRREFAARLAAELDRYHHSNPMVEFIGQSQLTMNAVGIAKTRYLEDVATVEDWKRVHEEILAGHGVALDFLENWVRYLDEAVRTVCGHWDEGYSLEPLPFSAEEEGEEDGLRPEGMEVLSRAQALLERLDDPGEALEAHVLLDNLIARADHKEWHRADRRIDWKLARALEREGRNAEASRFMRRMETKSLEAHGLPHEAGMAFLKDYARIVSSYDLCYFPDFDLARTCLYNVLEAEPGDEEARAQLREVNEEALKFLRRFSSWEFAAEKREGGAALDWRLACAEAEQALSDGNALRAFLRIWEMVKKHLLVVPGLMAVYLDWLTAQLARILEEEGEPLPEIAALRDEILAWMPLFAKLKIEVAPGFLPEGFTVPDLKLKRENEAVAPDNASVPLNAEADVGG